MLIAKLADCGARVFLLLLTLTLIEWNGKQLSAQDTVDEPGKVSRTRLPSGWTLDYDFSDLDVQRVTEWLRFAGVNPPTTLGGKVSGWVWAKASKRSWFALSDYRVEGEFRSPMFDVQEWRIRDANIRFGYQNQKWYIGNASGSLQRAAPKQGPILGVATLSAVLPTSLNELTQIDGKLTRVDLPAVLDAFQVQDVTATGTGTIAFHASAPLDDLSNPLAWKADGTAELTQSSIASSPESDISASWQLSDEILKADRIEINLLERSIRSAATLNLSRPWNWSITIPEQSIDVRPDLLDRLRLSDLPDIRGIVRLSGTLGGDLLTQAMRTELALASDSLNVDEWQLKNLSLSIHQSERELRIDVLTAKFLDSEWTANLITEMPQSASLNENPQSSPSWTLKQLKAHANDVRLDRFSNLIGSFPFAGNGDLDVSIFVPEKTSWNWTDWQIKVVSRFQNLVVERVVIGDANIEMQKESGRQIFSATAQNQIGEAFWKLRGQFTPWPLRSFQFDIDAEANQFRFPLRSTEGGWNTGLTEITPTGKFELTGDALNLVQKGAFQFPVVQIRLDKVPLIVRDARGTITESQLELGSATLRALGGELQTAGIWNRQKEGKHVLRVTANDLDLRMLDVLPLQNLKKQVEGHMDFKIDLTKSADTPSWFEGWEGEASATADALQYQKIPLGNLSFQVSLAPKSWTLNSDGELLKGRFMGSGTVNAADLKKVLTDEVQISDSMSFDFVWKEVRVDRLIPLWQPKSMASDFRGRASIQGKVEWSMDKGWRTSSKAMLSTLSYRNQHIAKQVELELETTEERLIVRRLQGALAHGRISGQGQVELGKKGNGDFQIQMDHFQLNEVAHLMDASWAPSLSGIADVKGDIRLRDNLTFSGNVTLAKSVVFDVPLERVHSNIRMSMGVDGKSIQIRCPSVEGVAFGGTVQGNVSARYGTGWSLDCQAHIRRGDVAEFSRFAGVEKVLGKGLFDGDLILKSSRVRAVDDLRGTVTMAFRETDAQALPLVSEIAKFAPVLRLPSADFQRGMLRGDIGQGYLRIRDLNLWGDQIWVNAHGGLGLLNRRLDVELTVYTGPGFEQRVASNLVASLLQNSVPSIAIVTRLNRLISNRAVFLNVSGTTTRPIIHPRAVRTFGRIALQSILEQALPVGGNTGLAVGTVSANATNNQSK